MLEDLHINLVDKRLILFTTRWKTCIVLHVVNLSSVIGILSPPVIGGDRQTATYMNGDWTYRQNQPTGLFSEKPLLVGT